MGYVSLPMVSTIRGIKLAMGSRRKRKRPHIQLPFQTPRGSSNAAAT